MKHPLAIVALASCVSGAANAASPPPVPENLQACSKLPDAGERVRCYDTEIAKMSASAGSARSAPKGPATGAASAASSGVASAAPRGAPQSIPANFGEETLPTAARPKAQPENTTLLSSITAMRTVGQEKYVISLANGQVWRQEEASQVSLFFRVGDTVRSEKGALGSYHMSTDTTGTKNWVRVTRAQ